MRDTRGITLVALVITIIVLLILAGVTIYLTIGENGLLNRTEGAVTEHTKQEATQTMNLKISTIQIQCYTEKQKLPNLQYLADKLCEDNEIEYVIKKEKDVANLNKIDVTGVSSIFTKIKKYPYEFEIDSNLRLASIDGVKLAENDDLKTTIEEMKLAIQNLQNENKQLKDRMKTLEDETIVNKRINLMNQVKEIPLSTSVVDANVDIILSDSIENYKYLEIQIDIYRSASASMEPGGGVFEQTVFIATEQLSYNNTNVVNWEDESTFMLNSLWGNNSRTYINDVCAWFKDEKTLCWWRTNRLEGTKN